ncbi:MAG: FeoA domain-containing protein [Pseudomonadales bacterium]|nr:FeoA domain-containing protein [Anaerolineales bacterium]MCB8918721.1 FeoA domain-containing protein [Ardenticatenaceae bacterium]MCP5191227.1 FeoA domain-containing protein [Pseudomonadales bacterium]
MRTHASTQESTEMYLKTMAELGGKDTPVPIAQLAERLEVSPVSANEMVKRLETQSLVQHERYKGVMLTPAGAQIAASIIRRQRLWASFLVDQLQLNWAGAYEMSCRLEHATSTVVTEALAAYLGYPTHCPHGNPIPAVDGSFEPLHGLPLSELAVGQMALIKTILPTTTEVFAHLQSRHLLPGTTLKLLAVDPLEGPLTLQVDGQEATVGRNVAALILVEPVDPAQAATQPQALSLDQLPPGREGRITQVGGSHALRRRYMEMGLVRGETIRTERIAPLGDPIEFTVKGYHLSLRRTDARHVRVLLES